MTPVRQTTFVNVPFAVRPPDCGAPPLIEHVAGPAKVSALVPPMSWIAGVIDVVLPVTWHAAVVAAGAEAAPPPATPATASDVSSTSLVLDNFPSPINDSLTKENCAARL